MSRFAGTGELVRLAARRDRVRLPVWVLALGGLVAGSAAAVPPLYETQQAVDAYASLVGSSPVTVAFAGPPVGLTEVAGIVIYEISFTAIVGIVIMAVTLTTRHTRAEEESGRTELVRATVVGRHAPGAAALLSTTLACLVVGVVLFAGLSFSPLTADEAALFSAGIALVGVVYAAVALCLAQLFVHSRSATGAALGIFAAGYAARAAGDVRDDWLVWLSPVGWVQASHVPDENRWWPLVLPVVAVLLLVVLAVALADRRDFGGGLLPSRSGPPRGPRSLSGSVGLAWRMQRGALLGWAVGVLSMALLTGALGQSMQTLVEQNPTMAEFLEMAEGASIVDSYLATMLLVFALVVGGFAVWSAGHPAPVEDAGQLELVLAGPVSRERSMLSDLAVTMLATTLLLMVSAVGLGVSHAVVVGDAGEAWRVGLAQLAYLPALAVLVGLVALARGWRPGWSWLGWAVLAHAFVIGWLGGLLRPPDWVTDLSVFSHVPRVPVESAGDSSLLVLLVAAVALVALGVLGFRRRDVAAA